MAGEILKRQGGGERVVSNTSHEAQSLARRQMSPGGDGVDSARLQLGRHFGPESSLHLLQSVIPSSGLSQTDTQTDRQAHARMANLATKASSRGNRTRVPPSSF